MSIGQRIKNRRLELGLTVDEVAAKIGKNRATVYRYESSDIEDLPTSILEPLAKVLHTTPGFLMGWEPESRSTTSDISDSDVDMRRIARARNDMTQQEKDKMMKIVKASFEEYFTDNYVDTTDYSDEDDDD